MNKLVIFIAFTLLIGPILVQASSTKSTSAVEKSPSNENPNSQIDSKAPLDEETEDSSESDSSEQNDSDVDTDGSNNDADDSSSEIDNAPSMTCTLFGQPGCNAECRMRALLYRSYGEGICTENQTCQCNASLQSFYLHWNRRFHFDVSVYTYRAIVDDELLHEKVMEIFEKNPLKTGIQYKELLKPILSPYEYSKLKVADRTLAAKFTGNGHPNKKAIQKYIIETLKQSTIEPLLTTNYNYKENFQKTLKKTANNGTLYNIGVKLDQLQNQTLNDIFDEYLKERNITKPQVKKHRKQNLDDVFEEVFLNYIIGKNNEWNNVNKKSPQTKKQARDIAKRNPSEEGSSVAPKKQNVKKGTTAQ